MSLSKRVSSMNDVCRRFFDYLILRGKSERTAYYYAYHVNRFIEWNGGKYDDISREDIMDYFEYLRDEVEYDSTSLRIVAWSLVAFFNYIGKEDIARWIPIPSSHYEEVEWLPEDVVKKVIDSDPVLCVAYDLALRLSEVVLLMRSDYNRNTGDIVVTRLKHKNRPNKYILKLSPWVRELLNRYIDSSRCCDGRIFCMSTRSIQQRFKNALTRAGLDQSKYSFHVLRHSRCTNIAINELREKGTVDIVSLAKFMGHLNINTTMMYIHIASKYLRF